MSYTEQLASPTLQNDYSEAIALYQNRIEAEPSVTSNYWHLGLALLLAGQESEAQLTWLSTIAQGTAEETEALTAELVETLSSAALRQEQQGYWQSAWLIRCYIHEFLPNDLNNLLALVWLSFQLNLFETEGEELLPAIVYGMSLLENDQFSDISRLKQVLIYLLEINPFHDLFEICLIKNEFIGQNLEFAEIRDQLSMSYNIAGVALYQKELLIQSLRLFRKALKMQASLNAENIARMYFNSGITLVKLKQFVQAKEDLEKAIEIDPQISDVSIQLSFVNYQIHTTEVKSYSFTSDWFSWNIPVWQEYLRQFIEQPSLYFLEIGSWEGRSTCWLLENILTHASAKITCIDTFQGSFEHQSYDAERIKSLEDRFDSNIQKTGFAEKVKKIVGSSHQVLPTLSINTYDVIYIDGSHLACDVLMDAILSWPLAKTQGLIIFDDYDFEFPDNPSQNTQVGIDAFLLSFADKIEVLHKQRQVIVRKLND